MLINGCILGGPPVLVGPGGLLGFLNLAYVRVGQLQEISGFRLLDKNGSGLILNFSSIGEPTQPFEKDK